MSTNTAVSQGRRRGAPVAVLAGVVATGALALSMNGTLAGFTAQITNSVNTAASGSLVMQEKSGGFTCNSTDATPAANTINTNAATCATINKYGGSTVMVPGSVSTTTVTIQNTGTSAAKTFTLTPAACVQSNNSGAGVSGSATDFCTHLGVVVTEQVGSGTVTTVTPASSTALSLGTGGALPLTTLTAGQTATFVFTVTLDSAVGNTYQGLAASQSLAWQFNS